MEKLEEYKDMLFAKKPVWNSNEFYTELAKTILFFSCGFHCLVEAVKTGRGDSYMTIFSPNGEIVLDLWSGTIKKWGKPSELTEDEIALFSQIWEKGKSHLRVREGALVARFLINTALIRSLL